MSVFFSTPDLFIPLSVMVCLLVGSGFFSSSETALFFLAHEELQAFQRSGRSSELRVVALLSNPDRLLTAVLFWNLAINLAFFTCGIVVAQRLITLNHPAIAGVFGFVSLGTMIVCGEVIPKTVAVLFRRSLALLISLPLALAVRLFDPMAPAFQSVTRSLRRMFWPSVKREPYLEPDDLEQAIDNSAGRKFVLGQERRVLHNILDLSEIPVEEVMHPRGTYLSLRPPISLQDLTRSESGVDWLVVLNEQGEDVEGVVQLNEFAAFTKENLADAAEPVIHVPWCATVAYVLHQMEKQDCSGASVVNEFGEDIGLVWYDDIVDTILAPDPSRARRVLKREPVVETGDGRFEVDAITSLRYLCRRLKITFVNEADGQVTVAGLFHEQLERIPAVGDSFAWRGFQFEVIENSRRGRFRVAVRKQNPSATS